MRRRHFGFAALLALAGLLGCARERVPAHAVLVPVVIRTTTKRFTRWATDVDVTNTHARPARVRIGRWPPDSAGSETEEITVAPGASVRIPSLVPGLPEVSSLYAASDAPFTLRAVIRGSTASGPLPPLDVPVVRSDELARPGDVLEVGPLVLNDKAESHFCVTFPWTERDTAPFRLDFAFTDAAGKEIRRESRALPGIPFLVVSPWSEFDLPYSVSEVTLHATFLGSARGRKPVLGLWVYGITQEKVSRISRFLTTRVIRKGAAAQLR